MIKNCLGCGGAYDLDAAQDNCFSCRDKIKEKKPAEIGGTHYQEGIQTSPWSLQKTMKSSGNAFVDGRRCDAIKYTHRMKGEGGGALDKLLEDMKKARHCLEEGINELEIHIKRVSPVIQTDKPPQNFQKP